MHICVSTLSIIGSDNSLSPDRRQAIIWTNDGLLLIELLGTNVGEILIDIYVLSLKKMHLEMLSGKRRPFCLGLNVLNWGNGWVMTLNYVIESPITDYRQQEVGLVLFNHLENRHRVKLSSDIDGLALYCSNSVLTFDLLQSCTKPSI